MAVTQSGKEYALATPGYDALYGADFNAQIETTSLAYGPAPDGTDADQVHNMTAVPKISYAWYAFGVIVLLGILKYASEHEKTKMDPKIVGIGVWNIVAIGVMASLFIVLAKTILNKYHVKGLTDLVNVV